MTAPDFEETWLRVARVVRPQGHRGEVLAELLTDFPERFAGGPSVSLRAPGAAAPAREATVEGYRLHAGRVVLKLSGCPTMNDAEALRGYELVVPWDARHALDADAVYVAELAGCLLVDARSGATVGTVIDVDRESSNSALLVIETANGSEVLVPFVKAYRPQWDLAARRLQMDLPEGLLELHVAVADMAPDERAAVDGSAGAAARRRATPKPGAHEDAGPAAAVEKDAGPGNAEPVNAEPDDDGDGAAPAGE